MLLKRQVQQAASVAGCQSCQSLMPKSILRLSTAQVVTASCQALLQMQQTAVLYLYCTTCPVLQLMSVLSTSQERFRRRQNRGIFYLMHYKLSCALSQLLVSFPLPLLVATSRHTASLICHLSLHSSLWLVQTLEY